MKFGALIFLLVFVSKYGPKFATGELQIASEKATLIATLIALKQRGDVCESQSEEFNITEPIIEKYPSPKTGGISEEITIGWVGDIPPSNIIPQFSETILYWLNANNIMAGNLE